MQQPKAGMDQPLWREYHEYLREEWERQAALVGIQPPVWMLKMTAHLNGTTVYTVGNDHGSSIAVTYRPGDLLPPPPL